MLEGQGGPGPPRGSTVELLTAPRPDVGYIGLGLHAHPLGV